MTQYPNVLFIMGPSFCGSSLLNLMLDSHPNIFGGGELHRLFDPNKNSFCSTCLRECVFWDCNNFRKNINKNNIYISCAERSDSAVVVDSSKNPGYFFDISQKAKLKSFMTVIVKKHPIRLAASQISNKIIPTQIGFNYSANEALNRLDCDRLKNDLSIYFNEVYKRYEKCYDVAMKLCHNDLCILEYEKLVFSTGYSINKIISSFDLEWDNSILSFSDCEHHPIGGNSATHWHIRRQPNPNRQNKRIKKMIPEKLNQYYNRDQSIIMDNKFRDIMSDSLMRDIFYLNSYRSLCSYLGYNYEIN